MRPLYMITHKKGIPITKVLFNSFEEALEQSKTFLSKTEITILYIDEEFDILK